MATEPLLGHRLTFGADTYVPVVSSRIEEHYRRVDRDHPEEPLVVGLFGPWGSGKTTWLEAIHDHFVERAGAAEPEGPLTIPVRFNAWRFENEPHLVIPLLKTAQQEIESWQEELRPPERVEERDDAASWGWLRDRGRRMAVAAIALGSGLRGKLSVPLLGEIEVDPSTMLETEARLLETLWGGEGDLDSRSDLEQTISTLSSQYYAFHRTLRRLTGREAGHEQRLNLVFLIDDLDRCLPEKSVQMLESIKLFLEVEGCAFVLALDDEVLERGIAHRYRDYMRARKRSFDSVAHSLDPDAFESFEKQRRELPDDPITGPEYLETIVHLPVRLPSPRRAEAKAFLLERFPSLFTRLAWPRVRVEQERTRRKERPLGLTGAEVDAEPDGEGTQSALPGGEGSEPYDPLVELFLDAVDPPNPRKLVRAAELLRTLLCVAHERGWGHVDSVTLGRMVLVQLFAPDVYRFCRRDYRRFLRQLEIWKEDPRWHGPGSIRSMVEERIDEEKEKREQDETHELPLVENQRKLVTLIEKGQSERSSFDVFRIVDPERPSASNLTDYWYLVEAEARPSAPAPEEERPSASPGDLDDFLGLLFGSSCESWKEARAQEESRLAGHVLDDASFRAVRSRVAAKPEFVTQEWLELLSPHLTPDQYEALCRESGIVSRLVADDEEHGWAARRVLESLCRKRNPLERPGASPVDLEHIVGDRLDLTTVPLAGAWLRGLDAGESNLPADLRGTELGSADLRACGVDPAALEGARLIGARLGTSPEELPAGALRAPPERSPPALPLPGHTRLVRSVLQLEDGRLVSAGDDGMLRLWALDRGEPERVLKGHVGQVLDVLQLEDGRLVSAGGDGTLRLWALDRGEQECLFEGTVALFRSVLQLDDGRLVSTGRGGTLRLWALDRGEPERVLKGHVGAVLDVLQLEDGRLVSAGGDGTLRLWALDRGEPERVFEGHTGWVMSVLQLDDGRLVSAGDDGMLCLWALDRGEPERVLKGHVGAVLDVLQIEDGRLVSAGRDHTLRLWALDRDEPERVFEGHTGWVRSVLQLEDGRLVIAGADGTLRLWALDRGEPERVFKGHTGGVMSVLQLEDGRLVSAGADGTLRLWALDRGEPERVFEGHTGGVMSVLQLEDGRLVSAGDDGVRVWDVSDGSLLERRIPAKRGVGIRVCPEGTAITNSRRPWRVHRDRETTLPADDLLTPLSLFHAREGVHLPAYLYPDRLTWGLEADGGFHRLTISWPEGYDWTE